MGLPMVTDVWSLRHLNQQNRFKGKTELGLTMLKIKIINLKKKIEI